MQTVHTISFGNVYCVFGITYFVGLMGLDFGSLSIFVKVSSLYFYKTTLIIIL